MCRFPGFVWGFWFQSFQRLRWMWHTKMQIRLGQHWWPKPSVQIFTTSHGVEPGSFGMLARAVRLTHHSMICTPELWVVLRNSAGTRHVLSWYLLIALGNVQQLSLWQLQQELVNVVQNVQIFRDLRDLPRTTSIDGEWQPDAVVLYLGGNDWWSLSHKGQTYWTSKLA